MPDTATHPAPAATAAGAPADPEQVVASAWADQALWSQVANELGDSIRTWRARAAVAGVAGLFISLLAGSLGPEHLGGTAGQKLVATLGVLLLALVPYLRQQLVSADRVLAWTRARGVAEQLKEAIYRHLMGALPPVPLPDGSAAADPTGPGNLVRRCRAIKQAAADLGLLAATAEVQPRTRKTRMVLADYLAERLESQILYYRKSSMSAGTSARWLQRTEFGLGLLTVLLGALAGNLLPASATPDVVQSSPLAPWLALIASAAAAVSSHIAGTRNLELAAKYFATHDLLKTLRDEWSVAPDRGDPARVLRLVDEVEQAIAAEHGGWVSGWQQTPAAQAAPAPQPANGAAGQVSPDAAEAPAPAVTVGAAAAGAAALAGAVVATEPEPEPSAPEPELLPPEPQPEPEPEPAAPEPAADPTPHRPTPG